MHVWHLGGCAQVQSSTGIHHLHMTLSLVAVVMLLVVVLVCEQL